MSAVAKAFICAGEALAYPENIGVIEVAVTSEGVGKGYWSLQIIVDSSLRIASHGPFFLVDLLVDTSTLPVKSISFDFFGGSNSEVGMILPSSETTLSEGESSSIIKSTASLGGSEEARDGSSSMFLTD